MKYSYEYLQKIFSLDLLSAGSTLEAVIDGKTVRVQLLRVETGRLDILVDGNLIRAHITRDGAKRWVTINGRTLVLVSAVETRSAGAQVGHQPGSLAAGMPGVVRALVVEKGALVRKGQTLAILEAMKMENKLSAPFDGQVKKLLVTTGQTVERDQVLMEIAPLADSQPTPGSDSL